MAAFCHNCGMVLDDGSRFCAHCGSPVNLVYPQAAAVPPPAAPYPAPVVQPRVAAPLESKPARKRPSTCLTLALISGGIFSLIAVLAALGAVFYFYINPSTAGISSMAGQTATQQMAKLEQTRQVLKLQILQLTQAAAELPPARLGQPVTVVPIQPYMPSPVSTAPQASVTPAPGFTYQGISFTAPLAVASSASGETVAAYTSSETGLPPGMVHPEYIHISLAGYPVAGSVQKAEMMIYPNSAYASLDALAGEQSQALATLLKSTPAEPAGDLPFLPLYPAAQMLHTKVAYLSFQNGAGVRYLTQYGQAEFPVTNGSLFYTFQGLTTDGKYYVAVTLPVSNPILPDDARTVMGADPAKWSEGYPAYKRDIVQKLANQSASSFKPGLDALDGMLQSLRVK